VGCLIISEKTINDRRKLLVQTVKGMLERFNMDIRNLRELVSIDPDHHTVTIKNIRNGVEYKDTYDKLLLSPGASPIASLIPGLKENDTLFTLRNIPYLHGQKMLAIQS
jgi:NADPH-dependent 2,4-dienoyl-CoA reductase/sulfur reductase-like enzyme